MSYRGLGSSYAPIDCPGDEILTDKGCVPFTSVYPSNDGTVTASTGTSSSTTCTAANNYCGTMAPTPAPTCDASNNYCGTMAPAPSGGTVSRVSGSTSSLSKASLGHLGWFAVIGVAVAGGVYLLSKKGTI